MTDVTDLPPIRSLPPGREAATRRALTDELAAAPVGRHALRRLGWAVVAATLAGAVGGGVVLFGNVSSAAAWTPVPDTLPTAETVQLGEACGQTIAALRLPVTLGTAQPVLAERRGSFQSVMVAGAGDRAAVCITRSADHGPATSSWRFSGVYEVGPARGLLTLDAVAGQKGGADETRVAFGQVPPQVAAVVVETADGRSVTASLAQGRWLAWWPSGAGVTNVRALDGTGRVRATVKQPAEPASVTPTQG